jgi:hypothetical protein
MSDNPPEREFVGLTREFMRAVRDLDRRGHTADALYVAQNLESILAELIARYMPNLSKTLKERLFAGYGPLASFYAKIDIAYALGLISNALRRDLHAIRQIRNHFAHALDPVDFEDPALDPLFRKFQDYTSGCDRRRFYRSKLTACFREMAPRLETLALARALTAESAERKPSPGKSQ